MEEETSRRHHQQMTLLLLLFQHQLQVATVCEQHQPQGVRIHSVRGQCCDVALVALDLRVFYCLQPESCPIMVSGFHHHHHCNHNNHLHHHHHHHHHSPPPRSGVRWLSGSTAAKTTVGWCHFSLQRSLRLSSHARSAVRRVSSSWFSVASSNRRLALTQTWLRVCKRPTLRHRR